MNLFKKLYYCLVVLFCVTLLTKTPISFALTLTTYVYARVNNSSTYIYSSAQASLESALFVLPESYFVILLCDYDETFYKVQYREVVGYVLKSNLSPVAEKPVNPFLEDVTFRVFSSDGTSMLTAPTTNNSTVIKTVELLTNINYYGTITGQELIEGRSSIWYYCEVDGYLGYLYSGLCDDVSNIEKNVEVVTIIDSPFGDNDNSYLYNFVDLTPGLKIILLCITIIPSIFLIYLLFKPYKMFKRNKHIPQKSKAQTIKQIQDFYDDTI